MHCMHLFVVVIFFYLDTSKFRRIFQEQITDLILVYSDETDTTKKRQYRYGVHIHIVKFFQNLQHLSISGLSSLLVFHNSSLTTCSSSILRKLCVSVKSFRECLALLDGRLKQLTTFIIIIDGSNHDSSVVYNMVSL